MSGQNITITLNPDKATCTPFTPVQVEYNSNLDVKINNTALSMGNTKRSWVLRPYIQNSHTAHKSLQIIKALTTAGCGKQKETLVVTYKAVMTPALEYAFSVW